MGDVFCCKKKDIKDKEAEKKNKEKDHEEQEHQKALKDIARKYKKNIAFTSEQNHLKDKYMTKEEDTFLYSFTNTFFKSTFEKTSTYAKEKVKYLTSNPVTDKENKVKPEDTVDKFFLQNYALQFLPAYVRIEVIILYGCYEIYKHSTRPFILNNNITMNEKINFKNILVIYY